MVFVALVAVAGGVAAAASGSTRLAPRSSSFLTLWQPKGTFRVVVEQLSLRSGRPLAMLAGPWRASAGVAAPHVDANGDVWITVSSGPKCSSNVAGCGPVPNSCHSKVIRLDPATGDIRTVETFARSQDVSDAIPSPRGRLAVLVAGGCTTSFFNQHLVVEDQRSGDRWSIGAGALPCHELSDPGWNSSGSQLVFTYGPSRLHSADGYPHGESCRGSGSPGIVVVSADHASNPRSWRFIAPPKGCGYTSAVFDKQGVAAFETCSPGRRGGPANDFLGPAYLAQLNDRGRVLFQIALKLGANPGTVRSDPRTGELLVTQDQTYRHHRPTHNWVWQLQGRHVRLIASYPFNGYPLISAQPW